MHRIGSEKKSSCELCGKNFDTKHYVATHKNAVPNSKARWNLNGRHFAIGDMDGSIHIKKLREKDTEYDEESLSEFVDLVSQLSSL